MGIAFLTKTTRLSRLAVRQGATENWQILVVETQSSRSIGLYVAPKTMKTAWATILKHLTEFCAKFHPAVVCGNFVLASARGRQAPQTQEGRRCGFTWGLDPCPL